MRLLNILCLLCLAVINLAGSSFHQVNPDREIAILDFAQLQKENPNADSMLDHFSLKVKELYILNAQKITQRQFEKLCNVLNTCASLKKLVMPDCSSLTNLNVLVNESIEELNITGCVKITSLPYLRNIKNLDASGCTNLSDLKPLYNTSIQNLNLSRCSKFKPHELKYIPTSLQSLNLSYCSQINNKDLKYIFYLDRINVTRINLKGCLHIKPEFARMSIESYFIYLPKPVVNA